MLAVGFLNFLGIVQGLVFLSLITKILGAGDFGVWSQIKVTVSLAATFTFLGLHEALIRFIPGESDKENIKEGIYSSLFFIFFINLVIALGLLIFSFYVGQFLKVEKPFVFLLAFIIVFESLSNMLLVIIRAFREIGKYFWFVTVKMILEIIFFVTMILLGYGLLGAVISYLLLRVFAFLILLVYLIKKIGFKLPDFYLVKKYLNFGIPTIADGFFYWVITSSDRYLIGLFLGIIFIGYYAPAYSIGYLLSVFIFPLSFMLSVVLPKLFDENNIPEVKKYLSYCFKYFLMVIVPATFGISVLSKELLVVFSTAEIAANAYFIVPFIAVSILIYGISYFFSQILVLFKKTKTLALVWFIASILNLGLNIILIPILGILGAALTTLLAYLAAFILMYYFAFKELQFKIEWSFIFKSFISSIVMITPFLWFNLKGFWGLISAMLSGIIVYLASMILFRSFNTREVIFLKNLVSSLFSNGAKTRT